MHFPTLSFCVQFSLIFFRGKFSASTYHYVVV